MHEVITPLAQHTYPDIIQHNGPFFITRPLLDIDRSFFFFNFIKILYLHMYSDARLKEAAGFWTKESYTNTVSRTFPLGSGPRPSQPTDDRHVERLRTNQMTGEQKVSDVISSSSRKADFIRMQREIVEEKIARLRKDAGGYTDLTPDNKPLPDIKVRSQRHHIV